jgi:hypothetical protein
LESRFRYGLLGSGAVSGSLIGRMPSATRELGPVSAASYRVASRIANKLRAGYPVRKADELNCVSVVLVHSPPDHMKSLLRLLDTADIEWTGKALVFCDCFVEREVRHCFQARGASTAVARQFGSPARLIVEAEAGSVETGRNAALQAIHRIARELGISAVEISPGSADLFDAAVTLAGAALTPLIDRTAALLREAGVRDVEAVRIASSLFEQTARDYLHSGKQSWTWYVRKPSAARLRAQISAAGPRLDAILRQLLLFGFDTFHKHREVSAALTPGSSEAD